MTTIHAEVLVLGGGPGGYTAAFRASDLGKKVIIVERYPMLGGVCLNVGCIPSKALLHMAQIIHEVDAVDNHGISYGKPKLDLVKIKNWKESITKTLNQGLDGLIKQRKIIRLCGIGLFATKNSIIVESDTGIQTITFDYAIIATGSRVTEIPSFPNNDARLWHSTQALELKVIPKKLLIIGGGIIGLELATVYHALGTQISIVEMTNQIIPECDNDLIRPLYTQIKKQYKNIWLETKVDAIQPLAKGLKVTFSGKNSPNPETFDNILVAVGRKPNGLKIRADKAGIKVDEIGFINVDKHQRTNVDNIFAIGDVVGNPMLAHKAVREGKVAAEVISGIKTGFDALTIPAIAYTDPEIAWMGLSEAQAKEAKINYKKAIFPWAASGRSLSLGRNEGLTKIICDKETGRILGAGMVGTNAGELIAEAVLALEMGADAEDIGLSIHPHPSLSETFGFAAEMITETITDIYVKKK